MIGRRMIATYSSAQTTPMPAAVISAGTKDPLACTMNPVTVGASAPPKYPPKFCIAPSDAVVFAGAAVNAQRIVAAFYLGEAVKLTVVVVLFVVTLRAVSVVPLAMLAGFAATYLMYWIALVGALPAMGTRGGA